jgi:PAS domain S-box-containing protein
MEQLARQRQLALDAASLGWWHYDPVSKIASWDDRYNDIFGVTGYSRPNDEILARIEPDDLPGVWAKVEAALDPVSPQPYSAQYRINMPDGSVKWIEAHGVASFEGAGENRRATRFVGTVSDITERKRAEEELLALNETLEQRVRKRTEELERSQEALRQSERLAAIGQMMTGLSHESRNALQRSMACTEMLQKRVKDQPQLTRIVEEVRKANDELLRVYEGVQDYARPLPLRPVLTDIAEVWREAWKNLSTRKGRKATLLEDLGNASRFCSVDPALFEQVFRNLFDNSLAATADPVELFVSVSVGALPNGPSVRVRIRDNGPGLPLDLRGRVFEPFFTTKTKGTGLGLAITKRIVDSHGGQISLGPPSDKGLEIILDLPGSLA